MMTRTTIRLQDSLLVELKKRALAKGKSLAEEMNDVIRTGLKAGARQKEIVLPVSKARGGPLPGVNLTSTSDLLDIDDRAAV